jgi:hypothetical protein
LAFTGGEPALKKNKKIKRKEKRRKRRKKERKKEKRCMRRREAPRLSPPNGASLLVLLELWRFFVFSLV